MNPRRPTPRKSSWSQSAQFKSIGRAAIRGWNAQRADIPRCGAVRKSDGNGCRQWPMPNGRCYLHGGRTPRGDQWHVRQPPATMSKLDAKLRTAARQSKRVARQLEALTPDERAVRAAWHKSHAPGAAAPRARLRLEREHNRDARKLMTMQRAPVRRTPGLDALSTEIERLRRSAEKLQTADQPAAGKWEGVFE